MDVSEHFPGTIWLCPIHYGEFYMPHGGRCPQPGCEDDLIPFARQDAGAVEALRAARDELGHAPLRDHPTPTAKASKIIGDALDRFGGQ